MYRTLQKIKNLMQETFGDLFKEYWVDSPSLVIFSSLPALYVAPVSTSLDIADSSRDIWTYTIDVGVIIDAKQELLKFKKEMVGTQFLTEIMEGKDDNGLLKSNTIIYVLRNNLTLGTNWMMGNTLDVSYETTTRAGAGGTQFVTKEVAVRFNVTQFLNRP